LGLIVTKAIDKKKAALLFFSFLPKILILFTSMQFFHDIIILEGDEVYREQLKKKENKYIKRKSSFGLQENDDFVFNKNNIDEKINTAYIRFIEGQFKIKVDEVIEVAEMKSDVNNDDMRRDLNILYMDYIRKLSVDDFGIRYYDNTHDAPGCSGIFIDSD
jgi:hypothetical protein